MSDDAVERVEAIVRIEQALFLSEPDHIWHGSIADIQAEDLRTLLALARSNSWQPIETAPKDETEILLYIPDMQGYPENPCIVSAYWGICGWTDNAAVGCQTGGSPTHWQPLPSPPLTGE